MENQFKPDKNAFIISRLIDKNIFLIFFLIGVFLFFKFLGPEFSIGIYLIILFFILSSIFYVLESIIYKKLFFIFYENKIIQKGGSLFSSYETELNIKNITHIKLRLPFIENKLFNTGHIDIESAGSSSTEIHICSMVGYEKLYLMITEMMKNNGFNLSKDELILTEKPDNLGIFFEIFQSFITGLFFVGYIINSLLYDEDGNKNQAIYDALISYIFPLVGFGVVIVFIFHIFKFLDLRKRTYEIYKNVIIYSEGFLSKNYSLLPFENLTDSGITQTIVDKIFGLYDVKISCQGSGREILFKNIKKGKEMSDTLDALISNKEKISKKQTENLTSQEQGVQKKIEKKLITDDQLNYDYSFTKSFSMDYNRTVKFNLIILSVSIGLSVFFGFLAFIAKSFSTGLFSTIFFIATISMVGLMCIVFIICLTDLISGYIKYRSTKFIIGEKNIQYKYSFLSTKEVEFAVDKITGVMITRSFIDEWFNTISIHFWSAGADSSLVFRNIKKENGMIESIMAKFGIRKEEEVFGINPKFSFGEYIKSFLLMFVVVSFFTLVMVVAFYFISIFWSLLLILVFAIVFGVDYIYKNECFKRTKLTGCKSFVYYQIGWLFKQFYYAKYNDIKDIVTTKYPFSNEGRIRFNIAGERVEGIGKNTRVVCNGFVVDYIANIRDKDELIDYIFYKRPDKDEIKMLIENINHDKTVKPIMVTKPSLKNSIVPLAVIMTPINLFILFIVLALLPPDIFNMGVKIIFVFVLLIINIIFFLIIYIPLKMTTYIVDGYRVLAKSGVIYKKQISVVFNKIDFVNKNQGFLNKIFKNGNVIVNTIGSSRAEIKIANIANYLEFYEELKKNYENN
jgi:uncharacterized membrane protein YdbT with pleckstrin-like domain